jgi:hypothetical protein
MNHQIGGNDKGRSSEFAEAVTLLACVREVSGSNLGGTPAVLTVFHCGWLLSVPCGRLWRPESRFTCNYSDDPAHLTPFDFWLTITPSKALPIH